MTFNRTIKSKDLVQRIEDRLRSGVRPEELAARAGVSVSTLYWVRRAGVMSNDTANKLSAALAAELKP